MSGIIAAYGLVVSVLFSGASKSRNLSHAFYSPDLIVNSEATRQFSVVQGSFILAQELRVGLQAWLQGTLSVSLGTP